MKPTGTTSLAIAELREFASFDDLEQRFIERGIDIAFGRGDTRSRWVAETGDRAAVRAQYAAYAELRILRRHIPDADAMPDIEEFLAPLIRITAQDLALERIGCFSAYRFLYERLLGAAVRPWLPSAFCAAAALPGIRPEWRKRLLQSLSEAAATAPAWSATEPSFYPKDLDAAAA